MMWSKIKKNIENNFTESLQKRVQVYVTSYGRGYDIIDLFNRGWITVDGKEVVNFATPDAFYIHGRDYHYATPTNWATSAKVEYNRGNQLAEEGEFSKFDLSNCCYAFLDMNIKEALQHESPIINMLAVLDRRVGKKKLYELSNIQLHPLTKYFLDLRLGLNPEFQ
jgi:hypothetical protein